MTRQAGRQGGAPGHVLVAVLFIMILTAAIGVLRGQSQGKAPAYAPSTTGPAYRVTVSVAEAGKTAGGISDHFIGLSLESGTLNNGYRYDNTGNLAQLLKNLGHSIMRFGGDTADTSYADATPRVLAGLNRLAKASGWSVLWSENLVKLSPARVAADAKALRAALGGSLFAIACGNEPDEYAAQRFRPASYRAPNYVSAANACYRAIRQGDPHAPVEGPDTASNSRWLAAYAERETGRLRMVGQHYYPLGCRQPDPNAAALLPTLLSAGLARTEARTLGGYVADARLAGAPLELTETNSACHGGVRGLSDAYASALWAVDFMLTGAEQGVDGMNFHGGLNTLCGGYTVLCQVGTAAYRPQPIYYGMLFTHLLGTGRFLPVTVAALAKSGHVAAFALKAPSGGKQRIMLENLSARRAVTTLRVGGFRGTAGVLYLTGPSPLSTSGVKIQGAAVAANGTLTPGHPDNVRCKAGGCVIQIDPYSAALVTLG